MLLIISEKSFKKLKDPITMEKKEASLGNQFFCDIYFFVSYEIALPVVKIVVVKNSHIKSYYLFGL